MSNGEKIEDRDRVVQADVEKIMAAITELRAQIIRLSRELRPRSRAI
jgi:hypothetical protein